MKEFIEKCLRRTVKIEENTELFKKLPLKYRGSYDIYSVFMDGFEWIAIQPKIELRLNILRHDRNKIEILSGLNCVLIFKKLNFYSKEIMMEEGIPFIILNRQMFLPFLGMVLAEKNDRKLAPVRNISFLTQKLLLCALYENWQNMNVTKIAEMLGVTKMSVSRCFDELEYLDMDILDTTGKTRRITVHDEPKATWEKIRPFLRSPIVAQYVLAEDIKLGKKAGVTALCEYSMLSDNVYPTYGIIKRELKETNIKTFRQIAPGEETGCVVLELGYFINFRGMDIQDPLSVWMSLAEEDLADERVQISIEEMLEEYVW